MCTKKRAKKPNYSPPLESVWAVWWICLMVWSSIIGAIKHHRSVPKYAQFKKSPKTYSCLEYGGRNIIPAHSEALFIRRGFLSFASLCFHFDVILKQKTYNLNCYSNFSCVWKPQWANILGTVAPRERKKKKKMKLWKKKKKKKQGFSSGEKTPLHPQPMFGLFLEKEGKKDMVW